MKELSCSSHILIGDYIDKDDESSLIETLDFVYYECVNGKMKLINGNHEEYVYRKLIDSNYVYEENEETQYFTSLKYLVDEKNDVFKKMFIELYEKYTYDYAEIKNDRNYAIISHSPCLERYLGKHSPKALKMMRNTRFFQNDDEGNKLPAMASMKDILDESASNKVLHVFGHVECGKDFHVYKNKICIDTACGKGGYLTALLYNVDSGKKEFYYEKSHKEALKPIYDFSYHIKPWTNKKIDLSPEQEKRLRRIVKADPAFISGTVSPSPSNLKGDISLESVETAIELFKSRNINKVIAQKKHMGSRCQVYLFKDRESCYATSRNGFKINKPEIESIIDKEYEKYKGKYDHQ
jgi:calcineurin-like phosphoesterase family protein